MHGILTEGETVEQHTLKYKQLFEYEHLRLLKGIWGQCYKTFYSRSLLFVVIS
jgi:hypothetical protein